MNKNSKRKGQSLMEVLVAMAIGGLIIGSSVVALTMVIRTNFESKQVGIASLLLQEMIDSARSMAEGSWRTVYDVEKGEPAYIVRDEDGFSIIHGVEGVLIDEVTSGLVGHWKFDEGGVQNPNLVTNWNGFMGNNTNFSQFTYDTSDSYSGDGMFTDSGRRTTRMTDELIPVDVNGTYEISGAIKLIDDMGEPNEEREHHFGVAPYDRQGLRIENVHVNQVSGSTRTALAEDLNEGDTTIVLEDSSGWHNETTSHMRRINFYPYVDSDGVTYEDYGYSRLVTGTDTWSSGGISGNVITLNSPWSGPEYPAGTKIANAQSGSTYMYTAAGGNTTSNEWVLEEGIIQGYGDLGEASASRFWRGTAYVRMLWLLNRNDNVRATTAVDAVVFREVEDEGVYVEKAYDSSTKGNHAVLSEEPNRPTRISAEGCRISFCLEFDGEGDYVSLESTEDFNLQTYTYSFWMNRKQDATGSWRQFLQRSNNRRPGIWFHRNTDDYVHFSIKDSSGTNRNADINSGVSLNNWHHLVFTVEYDGSSTEMKSYLDGKLQRTTTFSGGPELGTGSSYFGRQDFMIDDLRIYNRALSEEEVNRLYRSRFFTRYLTVSNVGRDAEGNILQTGGTDDPSTQKITGSITWENGPTLTAVEYITRFRNEIDHIRDWRDSSTYDEQEGIEVTPEGGLTLPQPEE